MKVFLSEYIHSDSLQLLQDNVEIISDVKQLNEVDGIITRNIKIDGNMMDSMPNLKVIGIHGTGIDDVDISEAKKRNIVVYNVPKQNADSVAELIVTLILSISRQLTIANNDTKSKKMTMVAPAYLEGNEISDKTIGLIGFGTIHQKVASILKCGFNMNVLAYSRSLTKHTAINAGVTYSSLDNLLANSDYVSIGVPLNEETFHLINKDKLNLMKSSAYLINTARGDVICENDLYAALVDKIIKGAALDVFSKEPTDSKLLELDNVIATPHIGANTDEALKRVGDLCVTQMLDALQQKKIPHEIKV